MSIKAGRAIDDIPAVAQILGRSDDTIRSMALAGELPGAYQLRPRGRWRIRRRDFDQWHAGLGPAVLDDPDRIEAPSRRSMAHRHRTA